MSAPTEAAYWEDWARSMGWGADQAAEAGRVGSLAVIRRMTPPQAMDCVVARVRDGRNVRIGRPIVDQLMMDKAFPSVVIGMIVLFLASIPYWNGGFTPALSAPIGFTLSIFGGLGLGLRGVSKHHWRIAALGIALNAAAITTMALSFTLLRS